MPNLRAGNKNGQTYEDSDQSDDEELAQVLEDLKMEEVSVDNNPIVVEDLENAYNTAGLEDANNTAVGVVGGLNVAAGGGAAAGGGGALVVAGGPGVAAGGGGGNVGNNLMLMPAQGLVMYDFNGCFKFPNFSGSEVYTLKHDIYNFKLWVLGSKLLAVHGNKIYNLRANSDPMVLLLGRMYDQYSWQFMQYVFRGKIEPPQIFKKRAKDFHRYLFDYKTIKPLVAGGTCDYQNFRNKVVIPVLVGSYGQAYPMDKLPGIEGNKTLQANYFMYPDPVEMEQDQQYQLQLDVPVTAF